MLQCKTRLAIMLLPILCWRSMDVAQHLRRHSQLGWRAKHLSWGWWVHTNVFLLSQDWAKRVWCIWLIIWAYSRNKIKVLAKIQLFFDTDKKKSSKLSFELFFLLVNICYLISSCLIFDSRFLKKITLQLLLPLRQQPLEQLLQLQQREHQQPLGAF